MGLLPTTSHTAAICQHLFCGGITVGSALPPTCTPFEKRFKAADYCTLIWGRGLQK